MQGSLMLAMGARVIDEHAEQHVLHKLQLTSKGQLSQPLLFLHKVPQSNSPQWQLWQQQRQLDGILVYNLHAGFALWCTELLQ
jgi:hypothetical protein